MRVSWTFISITLARIVSAYIQSEPGEYLSEYNATQFKRCLSDITNFTKIEVFGQFEHVDFYINDIDDDGDLKADKIRDCAKKYNVYIQETLGEYQSDQVIDCELALKDYKPREYTWYEKEGDMSERGNANMRFIFHNSGNCGGDYFGSCNNNFDLGICGSEHANVFSRIRQLGAGYTHLVTLFCKYRLEGPSR